MGISLSGSKHLLGKHEDLNYNSQHRCKKAVLAACTSSIVTSRPQRITEVSLLPAQIQAQVETLFKVSKVDSEGTGQPTSSLGLHMHVWACIPAHACIA